jgi:hypothetical protein
MTTELLPFARGHFSIFEGLEEAVEKLQPSVIEHPPTDFPTARILLPDGLAQKTQVSLTLPANRGRGVHRQLGYS